MTTIHPRVIDISHYDKVDDDGFEQAKAFGIWGVIHKASEGPGNIDHSYEDRRLDAIDAGLLWGAYHFIRPGDVAGQVRHFLERAAPDDETLLALDYEVNKVPLTAAREFLRMVAEKVGRKPVLYSGNTIKEKLGHAKDEFFGSHRLWLAQYGPVPRIPNSWQSAWLWQYTGDGVGPTPHNVPGIHIPGGLDISSYAGSEDQLKFEWAGASAK